MKCARLLVAPTLLVMCLAGCGSNAEPLPAANPNPNGATVGRPSAVRTAPAAAASKKAPSATKDSF
jgi:hypothetical protein